MSRRKSPKPPTPTLSDAQSDAHDELLRTVAAHSQSVPCLGPDWRHWTSENRDESKLAARACAACPVINACRDYAREWKENGGVWAGRSHAKGEQPALDLRGITP